MKLSTKFEHQIRRIHELIEQPGSRVTWDDRIPDPDNPSQQRQIDITVNHENQITLIECRIHNKPQDVKWIEELIGRKLSLRANCVVAVSASGFTEGAIKKARQFGIILRDFISLSREEIISWGKSTKVNLIFYEFSKIAITFLVPFNPFGSSIIDKICHAIEEGDISLFDVFNLVSNKLNFKNSKDKKAILKSELSFKKEFKIENVILHNLLFECEVVPIYEEILVPSVRIYGSPNESSLRRNAAIEGVEIGDFEITQVDDEVTIALDLSGVISPPNCLFRFVDLEFTRTVLINKTEVIGVPKLQILLPEISIGIQSSV